MEVRLGVSAEKVQACRELVSFSAVLYTVAISVALVPVECAWDAVSEY